MRSHAYLWYASADRAYGRRLAAHLTGNGVRSWWDRRDTEPVQLDDAAQRMLTRSAVVVMVLSRRSVRSPMAVATVELAARADRPVVVLLYERVRLPTQFQGIQCELMRRAAMPAEHIIEQLKDLTGFYEPLDEDEESGPALARRPVRRGAASTATTTARVTATRPAAARSASNQAAAVVVLVALVACVVWQPSLAAAAVRFAGSFVSGIIQFFRALTG